MTVPLSIFIMSFDYHLTARVCREAMVLRLPVLSGFLRFEARYVLLSKLTRLAVGILETSNSTHQLPTSLSAALVGLCSMTSTSGNSSASSSITRH